MNRIFKLVWNDGSIIHIPPTQTAQYCCDLEQAWREELAAMVRLRAILDILTPAEQQQTLTDYPSIYTTGHSLAQLRIDDSRLHIDSLLQQPSLGLAYEPPWIALTPQEQWIIESLEPSF